MRKTFISSALLFGTVSTAMALAPDFEVDQIGLKFTKSSLELSAGTSVRFHNSDDVIHNIMTIDDNDLTEDFGLQKPGEIIKAKFDRPGTFQVRCSIHPKMKINVKVSE